MILKSLRFVPHLSLDGPPIADERFRCAGPSLPNPNFFRLRQRPVGPCSAGIQSADIFCPPQTQLGASGATGREMEMNYSVWVWWGEQEELLGVLVGSCLSLYEQRPHERLTHRTVCPPVQNASLQGLDLLFVVRVMHKFSRKVKLMSGCLKQSVRWN